MPPLHRHHRALAAFAFSSAIAFASAARADTAAPDPAAVALFDQGRQLMTAGKVAEACPKFEDSLKITRSVGGLLNLADCYEKLGKTATAWASFRTAAGMAHDGKDAREKVAKERAAALEPKVPHLTVNVDDDPASPDRAVQRDGVPFPKEEWGIPMPVDPGPHKVDATAAGKTPFSETVELGPEGLEATVTVTALQPVPVVPVAPPPPPPAEKHGAPLSRRTLGVIVAGVGVAGLAFGAVAGLVALGDYHSAVNACASYPDHCSPDHSADGPNSLARTWATVSTVSFIAGGALATVGGVLFFTAPKASVTGLHLAPAVGPRTAGLSLGGAW